MNSIVTAIKQRKITEVSKKECVDRILQMLTRLYALAGQTRQVEDLVLFSQEMKKELTTRYRYLSLEEVEIALDNGVKGMYGEYHGINVVSMLAWIRAYLLSDERAQAKKALQVQALPEKAELTTREKDEIMVKAALEAFEDYKAKTYYDDFGNAIYNFLSRKGLIDITPERKVEIIKEIKTIMLAEAKDKAKTWNRNEAARNSSFVQAIIEWEKAAVDQVVCRAKKAALNEYFNGLVCFDIPLTELIDENRRTNNW